MSDITEFRMKNSVSKLEIIGIYDNEDTRNFICDELANKQYLDLADKEFTCIDSKTGNLTDTYTLSDIFNITSVKTLVTEDIISYEKKIDNEFKSMEIDDYMTFEFYVNTYGFKFETIRMVEFLTRYNQPLNIDYYIQAMSTVREMLYSETLNHLEDRSDEVERCFVTAYNLHHSRDVNVLH